MTGLSVYLVCFSVALDASNGIFLVVVTEVCVIRAGLM